jgi:hypothetical protein
MLGTKQHRSRTLDWKRLNLSRVDDPTFDSPFSEDELMQTIKELPSEKAPGQMDLLAFSIKPAGLSSKKTYWRLCNASKITAQDHWNY